MNSSNWSIDGTPTSIPGPSGAESNGGVIHILQTSRLEIYQRLRCSRCVLPPQPTETSLSKYVLTHIYNLLHWPISCFHDPIIWGCKIHRLLPCRGARLPHPKWVSWYDTKQSDGEVLVMLGFWRTWSIPSLPSLLGALWPGVAAPDSVLSMGLIELNRLLMLNWIVWNRTVFDIEPVYLC